MNNDKQIEKIIKDQANEYQIKTKSSDILSRYLESKEKVENKDDFKPIKAKKPFYKTTPFKIAVPVFSVALIALCSFPSIYNLINNKNDIPPIVNVEIPTNNKTLNLTSLELVAGVSMLGQKDTSKSISPKFKYPFKSEKESDSEEQSEESIITQEQFETIVTRFDKYYNLIEELNSYQASNTTYEPIESDDKDYPYCIKIDNFKFYYDSQIEKEEDYESEIESTVNGYIKLNDETQYKVLIEKEEEISQTETENETKTTIYYSDKNYVTVEKAKEVEDSKAENKYELKEYKDSKIFQEIEFNLEDDERTLEVKYDNFENVDSEYLITSENNSILTFNYLEEEIELIGITYNKEQGSYSYNSFTHKVK